MTHRGRILLLGLLALVYAVCYAAIKAGLTFAPPLAFAGLRAAIAAAALFGGMVMFRQPLLPPRALWPWIFALAVTGTVVAYTGMFLSPGRTGAGIASVLGNTGPLMIVALAAAFLGERITRAKAVALSLGFVGVSLISYPAITGQAGSGATGAVLALMAAAGLASESVLFKRADVGNALLPVAAWQFLIGSLPLLGLSAWFEQGTTIVWTPTFISLLLYLSLVGTAFAIAVWYWLVQRDEVGRLSLLLFLVPVLGVGIGATLFHESISPLEALGIAVTIAGLGFLVRESWHGTTAPRYSA